MAISPASAAAHAGLLNSDPTAGAKLGATPDAVRLSFSEQPEASLSEIRVLGPGGAPQQLGRPRSPSGDPLILEVPVRRLGKGIYTVSWTVLSAVDGHTSDGTFAFGVRVSTTGPAATESATTQSSSRFELLARWIFLLGVVALLGGAVAGFARFGGTSNSDLALAAGGWATAAVGLVLLAEAQRIIAGASIGELLDTSIGKALIWRAAGLGAAGLALLVAWREPKARRAALAVATAAALGVVVAHVEAGHAGAGGWPSAVAVSAQVAHLAAAGVWFGGLAALLLGLRGASAAAKRGAVNRFAVVALASLLIVLATGTLRAVDELASWGDLLTTGYGRAVLAKIGLVGLIAALALRRRWRIELGLAVVAIAVAALLGTLAPPVSGGVEPAGLSASGEDFGTTTRVELTTASDQPGPNLFTVRVENYDSGEDVAVDGVSLRFTPIDDPGVLPSSLRLEQRPDGTYVGSGPNLAFDGRWAVDVLVERSGDAVEVPLELDVPVPEQFVSVLDIPGSPEPPEYTMQTENGYIRISPDPDRPGPSHIYVSTYTVFESRAPTDQLVLTAATPGDPPKQLPVRRLGISRFVADIDLEAGPLEIGVVARTRNGSRLRGDFQINIPD